MYKTIYDNWMSNPLLDAASLAELNGIKDDDKEIEYRFGAELDFGTAGMRGIIGVGTNMMNVYTVKRATFGLARYILGLGGNAAKRGVVISFDTRNFSKEFALAAAGVLLFNGIRTYLFTEVHPVPMLSFAVRKLKAISGIMITASHNPKEYNGYKVYGADGAQMSIELTETVKTFISEVKDYFSVRAIDIPVDTKIHNINLKYIGANIDRKYYATLNKLCISRREVRKFGKNFKIVYTPIHGSGYVPVTTMLKKIGINYDIVEEQTAFDGNFPTVRVPNPEDKAALSMGIALADKIKADVVFGTDPDCDRLGVAVRNDKGEFIGLSGNQVGILLMEYVLGRLKATGKLPKNGVVVKSFVTTGLAKPIADKYHVELVEVPVGFKFIGEKIKEYEESGKKQFLFGFEESCGYLRGTHARDKDGVVAAMLFAEMSCYLKSVGLTVFDKLKEIYDEYGYVLDKTVSIQFSGLSAMEEMREKVQTLRDTVIEKVDIYKVADIRDYQKGTVKHIGDGEDALEGERVNAILYEFKNGSFLCVRPSGTEPKLKIYYSAKGNDESSCATAIDKMQADFMSRFDLAK